MKKITSIFTVSLVAILAAGAAKADISSKAYVDTVVKTLATTSALNAVKETADAAVQPGDLATVATTGSYNDLKNKPTIPAAITVDTALSGTSINPVQNKVINTALAGKQATLTAAQLSAANSGITADKITTYDGYATTIASNTAAATAAKTAADNAQDAADAAQATAESAATTANGKQPKSTAAYQMGNASGGWTAMTAAQQNALNSGATTTNIGQIATNTTNIATNTANIAKKQDALTSTNIKGSGSVSVSVADGVITVSGTDKDTVYTLPAATANALGGVKSGGNITVADDGAVVVNKATAADSATSATKATQDASGNVITSTYATKAQINALDSTSTGTGAVVTGVSQTDGKVSVVKGNVQIPVGSATGTTYATIWVE